MDKKFISVIASVVLMFSIAIFATIDILTSGGNTLSSFFIWAIGAVALLAIFLPKAGMYVLLFAAAYLDLVKRLLLVSGNITFNDVLKILAFSPAVLLAVFTGICLRRMLAKNWFNAKEMWTLLLVALGVVFMVLIEMKNTGSVFSGLTEGANSAAYLPLIFFAGQIFTKREEQVQFLKWAMIIILPAIIYGTVQCFRGYSNLEIQYMLSGYTGTVRYLDETIIRPFSTLSSGHAFGGTLVICFLCCIYFATFKQPFYKSAWWVVIAVLCLLPGILGAGRTGIAMCGFGLTAFILFRHKFLTIMCYLVAFLGFVFMVTNTNLVYDALIDVQESMTRETDWQSRMLTFSTFSDRLIGFNEWTTNAKIWTPFGLPKEERKMILIHDMLGQTLVRWGYIPLIIATVVGIVFIFKAHQSVFRNISKENKGFLIFGLSVVFAIIFSGMISGGSLKVYPINFFFWLVLGFFIKTSMKGRSSLRKENSQLVDSDSYRGKIEQPV